ncbi:MAG: MCE family protein [Tepidisphaera sp.]
MSSWATSKYNWLAGLFLVGGLAGTVALSFMFAGGTPLGWSKTFKVRFSLADGTSGLKPGSAVLLGGQQVGQVSAIGYEWSDPKAESRIPLSVLVDVEMRSDIELYDNASISLDKPLLGTISALSINSAGQPGGNTVARLGATDKIDAGDVLRGTLSPPAFLAQAGFGPEQASKVQQIVEDTATVMSDARKLVSGNSDKLQQAVDRAGESIDKFASKLPEWSRSLDDILATVDRGADRIDPLITKVDSGLDRALGVIDTTQKLIDNNAARFDSIFRNVDVLTSGLAGDTLGFVLETAREAPAIAKSLRKISDDASDAVAQLSAELPGIKRTLASTRQAADSLKIGIDEIVAQPWRVLQRPSTKELREQLVYDSARAYAQAVGDVRALGETLESTIARSDPADPAALGEILAQLKQAMNTAKNAQEEFEKNLLQALIESRDGR